MPTYPDKYSGIDFSVPEGVREACARGVELVEQGLGGDGLEAATVREARGLAAGELPTIAKVEKMFRFWARNERFLDDDDKTSPAWVSAMLWGGRPGVTWSRSLVEQMRAADATRSSDATALGESSRRWIQMFSYGAVSHPNGDFEVTPEFAAHLAEFAEDMAARGYYSPIARQHQEDGLTYGRVLAVEGRDSGVWALTELPERMAQLYDEGFLDSWSPSFYTDWSDPHTGKTYKYALRELSFVTVRHLKNLPGASPFYALAESGLVRLVPQTTPPTEGAEMDEQMVADLMAKIAEVFDRLARIEELLTRDAEEDAAEEMEDAEMAEAVATANAEAEALAARVAKLERENTRLKLTHDLSEIASADEIDTLVSLGESQRAGVIKMLRARKPDATELAEVGTQANTPQSSVPQSRFATACAEAKAAGVKRGGELMSHLEKKDAALLGEFDAAVVDRIYGA